MKSKIVMALDCACYLAKNIRTQEGATPDGQRVHNLLYLAFRECACLFNKPLFSSAFRFSSNGVLCEECLDTQICLTSWLPKSSGLCYEAVMILNSILGTYGRCSGEHLASIVKEEESWKDACGRSESGKAARLDQNVIEKDALKVDRLGALWNLSQVHSVGRSFEDNDSCSFCFSMAGANL